MCDSILGCKQARLRQLSPVFEATSSIERGSTSDAGGSDGSLVSGPSGHKDAQRGTGMQVPQVQPTL